MSRRLGVVMDPISAIQPAKDTTLALLLEAQRRGFELHYFEVGDLFLADGQARGRGRPLEVRDVGAGANPWPPATDTSGPWFALGEGEVLDLGSLDLVLMRKDPPVDPAYLTATWILDRARAAGARVVNRPDGLRDLNEKLVTAWFPGCCPATVVTSSPGRLKGFLEEHRTIVLKRVDAMGGRAIFVLREGDPNTNVILEEMTLRGRRTIVGQAFVPAVAETGDKRILVVDGEAVPQALSRIPAPGDLRANLATGATPHPAELTDRERWICREVGPFLRDRGIHFAGLDVIGGFLTEINVTSPTCIREIDRFFGVNVAGTFFDRLGV